MGVSSVRAFAPTFGATCDSVWHRGAARLLQPFRHAHRTTIHPAHWRARCDRLAAAGYQADSAAGHSAAGSRRVPGPDARSASADAATDVRLDSGCKLEQVRCLAAPADELQAARQPVRALARGQRKRGVPRDVERLRQPEHHVAHRLRHSLDVGRGGPRQWRDDRQGGEEEGVTALERVVDLESEDTLPVEGPQVVLAGDVPRCFEARTDARRVALGLGFERGRVVRRRLGK